MVVDRYLFVCLSLFTGAVLAPGVALAQDEEEDEGAVATAPPRSYIVAVPMDQELHSVAARVGAAARAALRELPNVDWQGPDQAFLGYGDYNLQTLQQARDRLNAGRQAYLDLELGEAIENLRGAVEDFDAAAAALEDPQDLGDALLFLGASQQFEGLSREARRTFARLFIQMPHIQPDPNVFNPDVVQAYERAQPRRAPQGSVTVTSEPPGAIAYVDYVARGLTPLTVDGLASGVHSVRVTRPGATPFVEQVEITRNSAEQVNAFLEDNPNTPGLADALAALPDAPDDEVEEGGPVHEIASALSLDKLGVIRVSPADEPSRVRLQLLVFDAIRGERVLNMHGPVPTAPGELEASVRRLVSGGMEAALSQGGRRVGEDGEVIPAFSGPTGPGVSNGDEEPAIYEQWWFWAAAGGAVALGVLLTVAIAAGGGGQDLGEDTGGQIILEF